MRIQSLGDKTPTNKQQTERGRANETCLTFSLEGALKRYHSFYDSIVYGIEMKIMTQFLFEIEMMES